jgi:hypothetical protein
MAINNQFPAQELYKIANLTVILLICMLEVQSYLASYNVHVKTKYLAGSCHKDLVQSLLSWQNKRDSPALYLTDPGLRSRLGGRLLLSGTILILLIPLEKSVYSIALCSNIL